MEEPEEVALRLILSMHSFPWPLTSSVMSLGNGEVSFDHDSPLSPLPSFAIREDDDELHIDGVGFIVNGVQSMEEGEKRERKPHL